MEAIEAQIGEARTKLHRLYDALETGRLDVDDRAPQDQAPPGDARMQMEGEFTPPFPLPAPRSALIGAYSFPLGIRFLAWFARSTPRRHQVSSRWRSDGVGRRGRPGRPWERKLRAGYSEDRRANLRERLEAIAGARGVYESAWSGKNQNPSRPQFRLAPAREPSALPGSVAWAGAIWRRCGRRNNRDSGRHGHRAGATARPSGGESRGDQG
jgi:hypothetical protein